MSKMDVKCSVVAPGETKSFRYCGEQTPNQVISKGIPGSTYIMRSGQNHKSWSFYSNIEINILVHWPTNVGEITNKSKENITVGGDGIFPN